ncbi:MAG: hypothetical protein HRU15_12765, partial [Planctomycetes bacterium]|nr:hypothetical protein [Planctomycetota bacterium]
MNYASYEDYCEPIEKFTSSVVDKFRVFHSDVSIAGHNVRLISPYQPLVDTLKPAIEHLSADFSSEDVDFEIYLIDLSRIGGLQLPAIPWEPLLRRGHRGILVDG